MEKSSTYHQRIFLRLVVWGMFLPSLFLSHAVFATGVDERPINWADLKRGGYILLLRHATTVPGTGDPVGYTIANCASQRNLSIEGREQAARWGKKITAQGVAIGPVLSSQWCRCLDTATIAFGKVEHWPAINSFFDSPEKAASQTAAVLKRLSLMQPDLHRNKNNIVLVTHQVNITALTGVAPLMGESVVVQVDAEGKIYVRGRLLVE